MGRSQPDRFGDTAVIFHWLIAFLIIGLLAIGKFMTGLAENDPMRFALTQWHKSFGIVVLVLSVLRVLWRFTNKPPSAPASLAIWQKIASGLVHFALYGLMFALPLTGWIMVSASPLNIDTVLFGIIPWPHIPFISELPNKQTIADAFHDYHEWASTVLIILVLAHIGAALKHHFVDKDKVLHRMLPSQRSTAFKTKCGLVLAFIAGLCAALYAISISKADPRVLAAGESEVSFIADVTGEETLGIFATTTVVASINENNPSNSSISATVTTASISTDNYQVAGSLPDKDWFDVENHPEAQFNSTAIRSGSSDNELLVEGELTMKAITQPVSFPMTLATENDVLVARGSFTIDRRDFSMGLDSQATSDYVGFAVQINFRFDILE